jgi:uncharacterized protein (DUF1697 family)
MKTYVSVLRGINVSGHHMIKMDALKRLYTGSGFADVQTYIQSGNVVFRSKAHECSRLANMIAEKILEEFGYHVPVMVLELEELKKIAKGNPYARDKSKDPSFFHISFLSADPGKASIGKIEGSLYLPDEFFWKGRAIYLYIPGGYGRTKLNNGFFESKLKLTSTTRNWKTVNELISMAEQISK